VPEPRRIYLDNAATSWPKPDAVYQAVDDYQRINGAAAGRGTYRSAQAAERIVLQCRKRIADLIGATAPEQIVFTLNGTDSLNLGLQGMLRRGDHVVTSVCEHNSVLRPLHALQQSLGIEITKIGCSTAGVIDPDDVRRAITANTKLIALTHASNVTGAVQPLAEAGRMAAEAKAFFLIDAEQSLGHVPVNVNELGCHLLAAPGHKGLLGPLGTGMLYVSPAIAANLRPTRQGGSGTRSNEPDQPTSLPDRFESGNLNVAGIAGLSAGVAWLQERGLAAIHEHELQLRERLVRALRELPHVIVYGPEMSAACVGVVSFNIRDFDPQEVAAALDAAAGLELRAGLHCAPLIHDALGTSPAGTVRASIGPFSTSEDVDALIAAVRDFSS